MKSISNNFYEINENFSTSLFHFCEVDFRTYGFEFDSYTSFDSLIIVKTTEPVDEAELKPVYRYADGFLINKDIVSKISPLDLFGISISEVKILNGSNVINSFYYMKIYEIRNCICYDNSKYINIDNVISLDEIVIKEKLINSYDDIFFLDDEYTIVASERVMNIMNSHSCLDVSSVSLI